MSANDTVPTLWAEHVTILAERVIPNAYAEKVGLRSIDLRDVKRLVTKYKGAKHPLPHLPLHQTTGILIPYPPTSDGIPRFRVRSDNTEVTLPGPVEGAEDHGAKTITIPRYICQAKPATVVPYITPEARDVAGDTSIPISLLEAPLKACSFAANIGPAIGMGGVLAGGHDVEELRDHEQLVAHPELRTLDWRKRVAHIIYDASITTNPMVALGAAYLAVALAKEGADTKLVFVPHFHVQDSDPLRGVIYKKTDSGPDDYSFRTGVEALKKLVGEGVAADLGGLQPTTGVASQIASSHSSERVGLQRMTRARSSRSCARAGETRARPNMRTSTRSARMRAERSPQRSFRDAPACSDRATSILRGTEGARA